VSVEVQSANCKPAHVNLTHICINTINNFNLKRNLLLLLLLININATPTWSRG
jgi:hypothetical protein